MPACDVAPALADEADDPLAQLGGGAVRERDREDPPRRDALDADEVGDPVGEHAGLARAGAGEDQQRALGRRDGPGLLRVERPDDLLGALRCGGPRRPPDRAAATGTAGSSPGPGASRSQAGSSGAGGASSRSANAVPTASAAAAAASSSVGSPGRRRRVGLTRAIVGRAAHPPAAGRPASAARFGVSSTKPSRRLSWHIVGRV